MTRWLRWSLVALLLSLGLAGPPATATHLVTSSSSAPTCPGTGPKTTDLSGIAGEAQPVILVHGWVGGPMKSTQDLLHELPSHGTRQYFLFDYERHNTAWAADPGIAACLADYIVEVSEGHRDRGGNGRVYLVAHSMGGLAIRFALDETYGGIPDLASRVGGVVTIDTPHTGSIWGDSWLAWLRSAGEQVLQGDVPDRFANTLPPLGSRAWACLVGGPQAEWKGCEPPPPLPASVQLRQLVGQVSVRRTLMGSEAYTMNLQGDGIVPSESQWGGGYDMRIVACTVDAGDLIGFPGQSVGTLLADSATLGIFDGALSTDSVAPLVALEPILAGLGLAGCSHIRMTENPEAIALIDEALSDQAAFRGLTRVQQLRGKTPIPASCDHPAAVARRGSSDWGQAADGHFLGGATLDLEVGGEDNDGPIFADFTDDDLSDAAVVMSCNAGGVGWPEWVLLYGSGPTLLGAFDFAELETAQEHATIMRLTSIGGDIHVVWDSYEGAGFNVRSFEGRLHFDGSELVLSDVRAATPRLEIGPGFLGPVAVGDRAQDLVQEGLAVRSEGSCSTRWALDVPGADAVWGEFRGGDPDDLDGIAVTDQSELDSGAISTAEGVGIGQSVDTLKEIYGDRLEYGEFPAEGGPYGAYVLFGPRGALMFAINRDVAPQVTAMYAVRGTSMSTLSSWVGGC